MFPEMRRKKQELEKSQCEEILGVCTHGVLALDGDGGYPYALPISYAYAGGKLYFHCAVEGHKLRAIRRNPKASFCVVAMDDVVPEEFTTLYRSVIAFGRIRELDGEEKLDAIRLLGRRYCPNEPPQSLAAEIAPALPRLCMLELCIEHITGKESRELAEQRNK